MVFSKLEFSFREFCNFWFIKEYASAILSCSTASTPLYLFQWKTTASMINKQCNNDHANIAFPLQWNKAQVIPAWKIIIMKHENSHSQFKIKKWIIKTLWIFPKQCKMKSLDNKTTTTKMTINRSNDKNSKHPLLVHSSH